MFTAKLSVTCVGVWLYGVATHTTRFKRKRVCFFHDANVHQHQRKTKDADRTKNTVRVGCLRF